MVPACISVCPLTGSKTDQVIPKGMGRRTTLFLSLLALLLCSAFAQAARELQQSEVKVCRYACGMGMSCVNGVCSATSVSDLGDSPSPAKSADPASPAPPDPTVNSRVLWPSNLLVLLVSSGLTLSTCCSLLS